MTTEYYRERLNNFIVKSMIKQCIDSLQRENLLSDVSNILNTPDFGKNASVSELYDLREKLFRINAFSNGLIKAIDNSELIFGGEFEDQKMDFEDLGIKDKFFVCKNGFSDPFSQLNILPESEIEIVNLSYPNDSNMVTAYYRKLVSDSDSKVLVDLFSSGEQETLLTLKILGENFKPKK